MVARIHSSTRATASVIGQPLFKFAHGAGIPTTALRSFSSRCHSPGAVDFSRKDAFR